jgi:zinc/manganese transport system ATP-binding protein
VLYITNGNFRFGPADAVMTSATLSELYESDVEVIRHGERLIVIGADDNTPSNLAHHTSQAA